MPVGDSGRIVVELDPQLKTKLHAAIKADGSNLKEWLVTRAEEYLEKTNRQTQLFQESEMIEGDYQ